METEYIKPSEFAKITGISKQTVYRYVKYNTLEYIRTSTNRLYVKNPNWISPNSKKKSLRKAIVYTNDEFEDVAKQSLLDKVNRSEYDIVGVVTENVNDEQSQLFNLLLDDDIDTIFVRESVFKQSELVYIKLFLEKNGRYIKILK